MEEGYKKEKKIIEKTEKELQEELIKSIIEAKKQLNLASKNFEYADGELIDYTEIPINIAKNLITRIKIISGMNITESRLPQDGAIKATLEDIDLDLRVSALPTNKGEKVNAQIVSFMYTEHPDQFIDILYDGRRPQMAVYVRN